MRYRAILFDLFRTVVVFTSKAPTGKVKEPTWRSAMEVVRGTAEELLPGIGFDAFLDALVAASEDIARNRAPDYYEVPIGERYRRAVARLGRDSPNAFSIAEQLAQVQLRAQAANTRLPAEHKQLLRGLASNYRLGLISNFDHGPTVHELLARDGLDRVLSATVISIEFGRRKPHPAIFQEALRRLDVTPAEALFVGESPVEDAGGARGAGLDAAWLNIGGMALPPDVPEPTYVLSQLTDLRKVLGSKGGGLQ